MRDLPTPLIPLIHHFFSSAQTSTFLCLNFHLPFCNHYPMHIASVYSPSKIGIKSHHPHAISHKTTRIRQKNTICPNKICIFQKKVVTLQAESYTNTIVFGTKLRIPTDNVPPPSPEGATQNSVGVYPYEPKDPLRTKAPKGRHNYIVNH